MERKAFIIFYIVIAITDSASFPSSTSLAESSSTTPDATKTANALLEIHCSETFIPELNDSSSQAFKDRAQRVKDNLETIYKLMYPSFIRAQVAGFRAGSILIDSVLEFECDVPPADEIANALLNNLSIKTLNIYSASVTVNDSDIFCLVEPITLPGSSTASAFTSTASETTMPVFPEPPSDFHSTTESSTTPTGSFTTTTSTTSATFTTIALQPTPSPLISASSFSAASASSTLSTVETSTTISTSKATSTLASSFTPTASTATLPTSATPSPSAIHATQSSTTPTSTTSAALTTTASQTTPSPLISAGSFSAASESTVETSTTLTTISSTATSTLTASSITDPGVTTTTSGPTASTTTDVPTTTAKIPEILTDLEFHSFDTFTDALANSESPEFKNRSKLVKDELEAVYKPKYVNFLGVIVQGFRPGSIITITQLVFSFNQSLPSRKEIADTLSTAAETGNVNALNIISQTISVNGSTFAPTAAPSTAAAASSASQTEAHLLHATGLIIMGKILRLFLKIL